MLCQIILIKNNFNIFKPLTYLSWIIRKVTKSNWNHVAMCYYSDELKEYVIADISQKYKFRTLEMWMKETTDREYIMKEIESETDSSFIKHHTFYGSAIYKGYEFRKLISHLTFIKFGFKLFKENSERFVCSELVYFLIKGDEYKNNFKSPEDIYLEYFI